MKRVFLVLGLILLAPLGLAVFAFQQNNFTPISTAAQVVALFTGCSGTQYLGADGACHTASGGSVTSVSGTSGQITVATGTTTPVISLDPASGSGVDSGSGTAYVVTGGAITSLTPTGTIECFLPTNANSSTTPTVAFNGLTAKTIIKYNNLAVALNDMITTQTACVVYNGTNFYLLNPQGSTGSGKIMLQASPVVTGTFTSPLWASSTNCAAVGTAANPSVAACTAAPAGAFSCATAASGTTCQVNTTAVTANSVIIVQQVVSEGTRLSVTCNTASVLPATPLLLSKSAGASFTLTMGTITTNPGCFDYWIIN